MNDMSICMLPNLEGLGGPASFYSRFKTELQSRGIPVHSDPDDPSCRAALIIGGTRHLYTLAQMRSRGVKIVHRLDGMNWIHRKRRTGIKHYLRSEINNLILATIRRYFAHNVIYQSVYVQEMWHRIYGKAQAESNIIYNGVDLTEFTPEASHQRPSDSIRLLVVEGRLRSGHEIGLENAVYLAEELDRMVQSHVELMVVAEIDARDRARWDRYGKVSINWGGVVPRHQIPMIDRSAHLYFSAEVNAPCPNSVIEAMACGLPVVSFATGSLPELVQGDAGRLVPYGASYRQLGRPDVSSLAEAALEIVSDQPRFRNAARQNAVERFNIVDVVDQYLDVLLA